MHSFSSLYNENTVISKEYTGPLDRIPNTDIRYTLPGQKYLNKLKSVPQVDHDRDTYATSNISP